MQPRATGTPTVLHDKLTLPCSVHVPHRRADANVSSPRGARPVPRGGRSDDPCRQRCRSFHRRREPSLFSQTKELVTGINSSATQMKEGVNENCRVFSYGPDS